MTSNGMALFNISQPSMVRTIEFLQLEDILKKLQAFEIFYTYCNFLNWAIRRRRQLLAATEQKNNVISSYA